MFKPARILVSVSVLALLISLVLLVPPISSSHAASSGDVVINEIAWMGTTTSYNDEWLELYNNTDSAIDLSGWTLAASDGTPSISLSGTIAAGGFYLLERTDDTTVSDVTADQIYTGALSNGGEYLILKDLVDVAVDEVDCSSGWFAGDNTSKATMERVDPKVPGSDSSNWANSDEVGGTPKEQNSVYGSSGGEEEEESLEITFTLPSSATAGEGFDVAVTVANADASSEYYAKALVGESTESTSLRKGYTYNSMLDNWLAWNGAWDKMPTFTTDADGGASFTLKSKVKDNAETGTYYYLVRIRKVGTDDNLDSNAQTFSVTASSSTSDSSLQVIFSVEGDSFKVNKSFDVKVEIKNAKALHDYYVKVRLGLEESKLTKGRTYNSFYDDWLADNASWTKFPVVYTDGNGSESITVSAKVASGNPADTYIIGVRIRDKETEKNYDSEMQTIVVGEEEVASDEIDNSEEEGEVLGALTELPATGGGVGVVNLFVTISLLAGVVLKMSIVYFDMRSHIGIHER